jgi:Integrase zinc binding domain
MHAIWVTEETRQHKSNRLAEHQEECDICAAELAVAPEPTTGAPVAVAATEEDPTVFESRARGEHLVAKLTANDSFVADIRSGYDHDLLFAKVLKRPDQHAAFMIRDQLIWSRNRVREQVLCVPSTKMGRQSLHGIIIDQAHMIVGHFGPQCTTDYIRRWYWWL